MSAEQAHILLIEDSETQALKLIMQLEEEGLQVSWVPHAEGGLSFLNETLPDLIVLDYFLPGMQGDAFCRMVRIRRATKAVPILMLTAAENDAPRRWLLDSGADDYLPKSESFDVLLEHIRKLLRVKAPRPRIAEDEF